MAGEEVVGGIVGFLRLDADEFHREITRALAEIKVLNGQDVHVDVKARGAQSAERDLTKVATAAKGAGRNFDALSGSFKGLHDPRVIIGGIAAGMALIGPVTGAATAAMGGFVGAVGTGFLAFKGFESEIKKGTALGQYLQGQLKGIGAEFTALGSTAASAMQGDVLSGLSQIRRFLPTLDGDVEALAGHLGRAFNTTAHGTVTALQVMMPLLQDGGKYAELLANKFDSFAASDDFRNFVDYARRELPNVADALVSVGSGVVSLGQAMSTYGDGLIEVIDLTGQAAQGVGGLANVVQATGGGGLLQIIGNLRKMGLGADDATKAIDDHTSHLLTLQAIQSPLASSLGTTDQALQDAQATHKKTADAAAAATLQMQVEGDAAGLLKQQLDKLNGKSISAAQAQNAFDSALANSNKHIAANGKTIDRATTSLSGNSAAAVANRGELIRQVTAAEGVATAMRDNGASQDETRAKMVKMRDEIIANAKEHGLNATAVQKFIDKIYKIPKKVAPTKIEVQTAAAMAGIAAFQKAIDALHGKNVNVHATYSYDNRLPNGGRTTAGGQTFATGGVIGAYAKGGAIPGYAGGTIVGPGTGTSDSVLAMVAQTKELLRVSNGEFISTSASRQRNRAALEAGNRGATLAVAGGGGGSVSLDDITIAKIAAAMSRTPVRANVTAGQFDAAMGAML